MMIEPELHPDDTQPIHRRPPRHRDPWLYALGAVIILGLASLAFQLTSGTLLAQPGPTPVPAKAITIVDGQTATQVRTQAATVADLLTELAIAIGPGDVLSEAPDTALRPEMTLIIRRAMPYALVVDGVPDTIYSAYDNAADILEEAGIVLGPDDRVWLDGIETPSDALALWPVPPESITIRHAVTLTIRDEDGPRVTDQIVTSAADTLGDALYEAGIALFLADEVAPATTTPLTADLTVTIRRGQPVTIETDGTTLSVRVLGGTVADALLAAGIPLAGLDYTVPDEAAPLVADMQIRVVRVREDVVTSEAIIPYETVFQPDDALELDTRAVIQAGQNGIEQTTTRIRYEDDVEVARTQEASAVLRAPVSEIVAYGTRVVIRTLDTPDGPVSYWRVLDNMITTSYHPAALGGDNITSIGEILRKGIIAVDPKVIPYRTNMYVAGYGAGMAADTGGPRSTRYWIDLGYEDADYVPWSRRTTVYLLTPVPASINYLLPPR
jgi:resuscitation-promoting factor RpfB